MNTNKKETRKNESSIERRIGLLDYIRIAEGIIITVLMITVCLVRVK